MEREIYLIYARSYAALNNYKLAYEFHVKGKQLTDSIFNVENSKEIGDLKTQFEVDKKEAELKVKAEAQEAINEGEKKRQVFITYAVGFVLLIVIIFSGLLYKRFRLTNKQKLIIVEKSNEVAEKNKSIMDSIYYARRIQSSLLPTEKYIKRILNKKDKNA